MIEFLLNHDLVRVESVAPNMSVLDWLRTNNGLTGTKEGCASGDCGACTVVLGAEVDGDVVYQSLNACLLLVGNLHGKQLITVEALSALNATTVEHLHPVQRAMVECHGSQCGFCTPGFIMSMFSLYVNYRDYPGDATVLEKLGGNLCRCTGYRPIIEACRYMYELPRAKDAFTAAAKTFFARKQDELPCLQYGDAQFFLPQRLAQLTTLKHQYPQAKLISGGTDLSLEFTQMLKQYQVIISLTQVPELQSVVQNSTGMRIGAAAPYTSFVPTFCEQYPEATEMFHRLGSAQIRNAGTLGGSLGNASPIGDPAPLLLALNASIEVVSLAGTRTIPLDDFFVAYRQTVLTDDEIIAAIVVPARVSKQHLACYKISKRIEDDISAVLLAISFVLEDGVMQQVKTGFGGMAATPLSSMALEAFLEHKPFTEETMKQAGAILEGDFNPMSDVRATREYRITTCKNLLQRLWLEQSTQYIARVSHAAL